MMRLINYLISKFLLVKVIKSKEGHQHFKRWRFFACPWLRIYLHKICLSDMDHHMHTHPWNFISFILKGGYSQWFWDNMLDTIPISIKYKRFDAIHMSRHQGHKISLTESPTWTLVFAYGKYQRDWGYLTENGFVNYKKYRDMKNNGEL